MSHIPIISNIDSGDENISLRSAASYACLDHLDGNGSPNSLFKEIKMSSFFLYA